MDPVASALISALILLIPTVIIICIILGFFEEKIKVLRPGLAHAIDIVVDILIIQAVFLVRPIVLAYIFIVDPSIIHSTAVTVITYGFYIPMLPCIYDITVTLGTCCSRTIVKLQHNVTYVTVTMGAKSPEGYEIFRYSPTDQLLEEGFCRSECAIFLKEYETKEKCALIDKYGHTFHHKCLYESLAMSTRCPLCRQSIKDGEELHVAASN